MKNVITVMLALTAMTVSVHSFAGKPILNVPDTPVNWMPAEKATMANMEQAIIRACISKGWTCITVEPGKIAGQLVVRSHVAKIEFTYDADSYAINYVDSTNLDYNAKKGTIHRNYNNWIIYLQQNIAKEAMTIQ